MFIILRRRRDVEGHPWRLVPIEAFRRTGGPPQTAEAAQACIDDQFGGSNNPLWEFHTTEVPD